jgi:hypothetical protein
VETPTAGSASGLGKRTGSNPDTAPQADSTTWRARQVQREEARYGMCRLHADHYFHGPVAVPWGSLWLFTKTQEACAGVITRQAR